MRGLYGPELATSFLRGLCGPELATSFLRGLRYLGFTGHSLEEGVEGVEDPGAEEAEDLGTHDVGQGADVPVVEDQATAWWNAQLWLKTIQGLKTQRLKTKNRGQPPIYVGF